MARVQCVTCGGIFDQVQADGAQYFHVCPPLSAGELAAAVKAGKVILPPGEDVDTAIASRLYLRANARDENAGAPDARTQLTAMKSPGKGVIPAPVVLAHDPVVVPD